jgi:uncharacterized protein YbjT (DUF2867 family)
MILVVGGTGRLGRELVGRLTAAGHEVRVLTRDAAHAEGLAAEIWSGDVRDAASLAGATSGVSTVISAAHGFLGGRGAGPEEIDDRGNGNLVRAALDAGVEHFVLMSVLGARSDHPMSLHRAKHAAEQHVRSSGMSWTALRPSSYVETWIGVVGARLGSGRPALVFGRGDNPINFVSVQDVATLCVRAVTDSTLRDRAVDVAGPDNLTLSELARKLGADRIRHVPRALLRVLATATPLVAPAVARQTTAALAMDTTDMTAEASALRSEFPEITWHRAGDIAEQFRAASGGTRRRAL